MKQVILVFILFASFVSIQQMSAQKIIEKGYIKIEVTNVFSENEQMQAMSGMLKGSTTEIYFTSKKSYSKVNMMNGMSVIQNVNDYDKKENLMLMSVMGQKMMVKMNEEEVKELESANVDQGDLEYKHFHDQTKEILGFKCHKVEMKINAEQEVGMSLWVTEEITTKTQVGSGIQTEKLGGFPLEYVISVGGQLDMTMTATKFEQDFDEKVFEMDTSGYKEMTMEEYIESLGQMGGGF